VKGANIFHALRVELLNGSTVPDDVLGGDLLKWILFAVLVAALTFAAACSDDDDDDDTGGTATASVCDEAQAVQDSVAELSDLDVLAEGTNALSAAVTDVKTELADLRGAVSADVEDEVEAMESAVTDAEEILSGIEDDATLNEMIDDVQSALTGIATAATALDTALQNDC
jgi:hypothetical protein